MIDPLVYDAVISLIGFKYIIDKMQVYHFDDAGISLIRYRNIMQMMQVFY